MTDSSSADHMRQRLLDAALAILQSEGAAALTVRNITERAGCSTTGIYTYFGGKHGLIEAIYVDGFQSFDAALEPAYASLDFLAAGRLYRQWALANPMQYLVMFGRAVPDYEPSEEAFAAGVGSFAKLIDMVSEAGAGDPLSAAYHLYATAHGYVMLELVGMSPVVDGAVGHHPAGDAHVGGFYETGMRHALVVLNG